MARLKASLEERPPTAPLRVSLWENTADRKFYFLSGQHIGQAVKKIRDERENPKASVCSGGIPMWRRTCCGSRPP